MNDALPSLGARLRLQFLLLGAVPVLAVFAVAWSLVAPSLVAQAETRNRELALAVRDQVRLQLDLRLGSATVLADELARDVRAAHEPALAALVARDRFLQAAFIVDRSGRVVAAAIAAGSGRFAEDTIGLDLSALPHLQAARQRDAGVWSDAYLSTLTGQVTAALAVPAGAETVLLELSLQALSQSVGELTQSSATKVVIVDRAGHVIAHPDARYALQQENLSTWPLVQAALRGEERSGRTRYEDAEQLTYALPVKPIGWGVLVSQPLVEVMSPVLRIGGAIFAVLAVTLALALWVGSRMARQSGAEVGRLVAGAQEAAEKGAPTADLHFRTAEFSAVWMRLRELFQQLHQRDEQTRAAQADLQAVLDAATQVAIIAMDPRGVVTVFNVGAERMLGWQAAEVIGRVTPQAWHDAAELDARGRELAERLGHAVEGVEALLIESRHGGYEVRDWRLCRRDGRMFDVSMAVTAMHTPHGKLKGFLGVAIDITERRRAAELEVARRTAELANQAKSSFLSKMSHELRTPLNAILGFAQLIELDPTSPPSPLQRDGVRMIQDAGWHLVRLIDDVLDLARIESGQVRIDIVPVDVRPLLTRAAELVSAVVADQQLNLEVATDGQLPAQVACDPTRLVQVLVNLLSNAAKYNRPGGSVRLGCRTVGQEVHFTVEDTGLGMTATQLAHLFEPFNRLGRETGPVKGTGIGLVITRHLVALMGGRLEVQSEAGVGTQFLVALPAAHGGVDTAAQAAAAIPSDAPMTPARGRVLYIEDNEINAQLMRALLRQRPAVELRICGTAASGTAEARAWQPQLALLDMHLPDADGDAVMAEWQSDPALRDIPVIAVSADATQARLDAVNALGARAYLTKPLDMRQVLQVIDEVLGATETRDLV